MYLLHVDTGVKEKVTWYQTRRKCYAAVSLTLNQSNCVFVPIEFSSIFVYLIWTKKSGCHYLNNHSKLSLDIKISWEKVYILWMKLSLWRPEMPFAFQLALSFTTTWHHSPFSSQSWLSPSHHFQDVVCSPMAMRICAPIVYMPLHHIHPNLPPPYSPPYHPVLGHIF